MDDSDSHVFSTDCSSHHTRLQLAAIVGHGDAVMSVGPAGSQGQLSGISLGRFSVIVLFGDGPGGCGIWLMVGPRACDVVKALAGDVEGWSLLSCSLSNITEGQESSPR